MSDRQLNGLLEQNERRTDVDPREIAAMREEVERRTKEGPCHICGELAFGEFEPRYCTRHRLAALREAQAAFYDALDAEAVRRGHLNASIKFADCAEMCRMDAREAEAQHAIWPHFPDPTCRRCGGTGYAECRDESGLVSVGRCICNVGLLPEE
jgi:hypothetical protein